MFLFQIQHGDVRAQRGEDIEQRGARGIEADGIEHQGRAGEESGGTEEECRRGDVAGNGGFDGVKFLRAGDGDGISGARELGAECAQGQLAVVAGADGFAHGGGAGGLQAGEQDACLYLRARDRRGVVDGLEWCAFDGHRRVAVGQRDARAHAPPAACECAPWAGARGTRRR